MTENKNNWFSKHVDTAIVLGAILSATLWITSQIHSIDHRLTVIETVMVMKNILPRELCKVEDSTKNQKVP